MREQEQEHVQEQEQDQGVKAEAALGKAIGRIWRIGIDQGTAQGAGACGIRERIQTRPDVF